MQMIFHFSLKLVTFFFFGFIFGSIIFVKEKTQEYQTIFVLQMIMNFIQECGYLCFMENFPQVIYFTEVLFMNKQISKYFYLF